MELNLKYTAIKVDEIEQSKKLPIENCIADNTVSNLALLLSKGMNGGTGVSKSVALDTIDQYLKEKDKDDLLLDITEALVNDGFLSRTLDVTQIRELKMRKQTEVLEEIKNL